MFIVADLVSLSINFCDMYYLFFILCNFTACRHCTLLHKNATMHGFRTNLANWPYDSIYIMGMHISLAADLSRLLYVIYKKNNMKWKKWLTVDYTFYQ